MRQIALLVAVAFSVTGCPLDDGGSTGDTDGGAGGSAGAGGTPAAGEWDVVAGPCQGSQTNAMYFDDDGVGYIGCGENADGTGLHRTTDRGRTWASVEGFERVRVSDVRRGPDDALRIAGKDTGGPSIAYRYDDRAKVATTVLEYGPAAPFMRIGHAENFLVSPDGAALVDSLTGAYLGYRAAGTDDFVEYREVDDATDGPITLRRVGMLDGAFFGVGGVINDPPMVYLQSPDGRPYFTSVALGEGNDGELLGFADVGDDVLVVGWDQTGRAPLIFRGAGDLAKPESWRRLDLTDLVAEGAIRDVRVRGDRVLLVGEKFPTAAGGFALRSSDRGETWSDITPDGASVLSRGWLFADGVVVVAGAGGYLAVGAP